MGLSPTIWGSQAWQLIHCVALTYPQNPTEQDRENYLGFLKMLGEVLPCEICAEHFRQNMDAMPPRMDNRTEFFEWTVDIHNLVNQKNGKRTISYKEALIEVEANAEYQKTRRMIRGAAFSVALITLLLLVAYQLAKKR